MRTLDVNLREQDRASYSLVFGRDLGPQVGRWLRERGSFRTAALITDQTVDALHGERWTRLLQGSGIKVTRLPFPAGEGSKNRRTKAQLEDRMLEAGLGRDGLVVALGGGVTLDLAGFVAATYMRGLPWLALPTSTLAMVDSSIGGKTGVDTALGKNLIGAFHPPLAVFADSAHLDSLPQPSFLDGFAEAIKHGLIASAPHFLDLETHAADILRRDAAVLEKVLADSAAIKVRFVEADEREADARKALNYGHTFAHALERMSGWRLHHGQAVARGLVAEARLARAMGFFSAEEEARLQVLLSRFGLASEPFEGLPIDLRPGPGGNLTPEAYFQATRCDKKVRAGRVEYVLLSRIGRVMRGEDGRGDWSWPVDDEMVKSVLLTPAGRA